MPIPFVAIALVSLIAAADPTLFTDPDHTHRGCYKETANLNGTSGGRALSPGTSLVVPGEMTAQMCLDFCASEDHPYAGVKYSRECWCSHFLSDLSEKLDDAECNHPCAGAPEYICGGAWTLSVYELGPGGSSFRLARALLAVGVATMELSLV